MLAVFLLLGFEDVCCVGIPWVSCEVIQNLRTRQFSRYFIYFLQPLIIYRIVNEPLFPLSRYNSGLSEDRQVLGSYRLLQSKPSVNRGDIDAFLFVQQGQDLAPKFMIDCPENQCRQSNV
jgi:hypothetical protein